LHGRLTLTLLRGLTVRAAHCARVPALGSRGNRERRNVAFDASTKPLTGATGTATARTGKFDLARSTDAGSFYMLRLTSRFLKLRSIFRVCGNIHMNSGFWSIFHFAPQAGTILAIIERQISAHTPVA
jgi:hypothetical protein